MDTVDTETGARCEGLYFIGVDWWRDPGAGCVVTSRGGEKGLELKTKVRKDFTIMEKPPINAFFWLKCLLMLSH